MMSQGLECDCRRSGLTSDSPSPALREAEYLPGYSPDPAVDRFDPSTSDLLERLKSALMTFACQTMG
jgi:hypothetical protein